MINYKVTPDDKLVIELAGRVDSTNAEENEKEIDRILDSTAIRDIVFDLEKLEYISSAGLRILLKTKKRAKTLKAVNVSKDVFEVFKLSGFTEIIDVEEKMKEVSVLGLEVLGQNSNSTKYIAGKETIIKAFNKDVSLATVEKDRENSKKAFVLGVPTIIPYEIVKVGARYGIIYELLENQTLIDLIKDKAKIRICALKMVKLMKEVHSIKIENDEFPNLKEKYYKIISLIEKDFTADEAEMFYSLYRNIPDSKTFCHGDFNPKNIVYKENETLLIDMGQAGMGHPIFDMAGLAMVLVVMPKVFDDENYEKLYGLDKETANELWTEFIKAYFEKESKSMDFIAKVEEQCVARACFNVLVAAIRSDALPSGTNTVMLNEIKKYIGRGNNDIEF